MLFTRSLFLFLHTSLVFVIDGDLVVHDIVKGKYIIVEKTTTRITETFTCPVQVAYFLQREQSGEFYSMNNVCTKGSFQVELIIRYGLAANKPSIQLYVNPKTSIGWQLSNVVTEREIVRKSLADRITAVYPIGYEYRIEMVVLAGNPEIVAEKQDLKHGINRLFLSSFDEESGAIEVTESIGDHYSYIDEIRYQDLQDNMRVPNAYVWRWNLKSEVIKSWLNYNCAPWGYDGPLINTKLIPVNVYKEFLPIFGASILKGETPTSIVQLTFSVLHTALSTRVKNFGVCYRFDPVVSKGNRTTIKLILTINWAQFFLFNKPPFSHPFTVECKEGLYIKFTDQNSLYPKLVLNSTFNPLDELHYLVNFKPPYSVTRARILPVAKLYTCFCFIPNSDSKPDTQRFVNKTSDTCKDEVNRQCVWYILDGKVYIDYRNGLNYLVGSKYTDTPEMLYLRRDKEDKRCTAKTSPDYMSLMLKNILSIQKVIVHD